MRTAILLSSVGLAAHVGGLPHEGVMLLVVFIVTAVAVGLFAVSSRPLPQQDWLLFGLALGLGSFATLLVLPLPGLPSPTGVDGLHHLRHGFYVAAHGAIAWMTWVTMVSHRRTAAAAMRPVV